MGFAKAFTPASVPNMSAAISRPVGLLWLLAALLWIAAATMMFWAPDRWWVAALPALVLSQVLIVDAWHDARVGTVANLILLVPIALASLLHAPWSFGSEYGRGVKGLAGGAVSPASVVTEHDIAGLPVPLRRYLRYTGAIGQPRIQNFRVRFGGGIREGADDAFMASTTDQFSQVQPASRWFLMRANRAGVPFEALHVYSGPHATFRVRVAGLVTVVDANGPEMDQSETVTLFNDLCLLAPAALISAHVIWHPVDDHTVRARFENAGHSIEAELVFNDDGALTTFSSADRYASADGKTYTREEWTTPVSSYRWFGSRRVVATADARWTGRRGDFAYARFAVTDIAYNVSDPLREPHS